MTAKKPASAKAAPRFYIYEHWRPDTDVCFYVGKGTGKRAFKMVRNPRHTNIQNKLIALGLRVDVRIIETGLTECAAHALEAERIAFWRSAGAALANLTSGGEGLSGYTHTPEAREKNRRAATGRRHTPETCQKLSAAATGHVKSEETRKKLSCAHRGNKHRLGHAHTIAARQRMSASAKTDAATIEGRARRVMAATGRIKSPETRAKISAALMGNNNGVGPRRGSARQERETG